MPEDPAPTPVEAQPAPKAEPAPAAPDQAGELKQLRKEVEHLRERVSKIPEELVELLNQQRAKAKEAPEERKPRKLPGFKPGVFKAR